MNTKRILLGLTLCVFGTACNNNTEINPEIEKGSDIEVTLETPNENDADYNWDDSEATHITLKNSAIEISGEGATYAGSVVTITNAGTYNINGVLENGQVIIDTQDSENVNLIFNSLNISNNTSSAVSIANAVKVVIQLKENTENYLSDGASYSSTDEKNATLYSKADLSFFGTGKLTVNGNFQDGIVSKDGLIIENGNFVVNAIDDAIRGKDYVLIHDGSFNLVAGGDALASDNDEDETRGYVDIRNGEYSISAGADGIQAVTVLSIENGDFDITTGGGSSQVISNTSSAKALKAGVKLALSGGKFNINAADDALHSNQFLTLNDGTFIIATADDAVHADEDLLINGGNITISKSYEGLESKSITINDGSIWISSSDDGVNAADGSSTSFGGGGNSGSASVFLIINGGYLVINSSGDGLDSNGNIQMSGGTVIIYGPTQRNNGSLDYDYTFSMDGGTLIAAGSSGMMQGPSSGSKQLSVALKLNQTVSAGTLFEITDSQGNEVICIKPLKDYQSVVYSGPNFSSGTSYVYYLGGTSTGIDKDGIISGGQYSGGTKSGTFSL